MRGARSSLAVGATLVVATGCTHDFDSFVIASDAASQPVDAGGSGDAGDGTAPPSDGALDGTATCAPGAIAFGGHCYFAPPARGSFDVTRAACVSAGAHLVTIGSAAEQNAAAQVGSGSDRWVGLARAADAGATDMASFGWITGEPNTFANWTPGEPNGSGPCVRMKADGTWADQVCATVLSAICEHE